MDYHVYILQSESTGRYYIGHSADLARRVRQHNDSQYKGTRTTKRFQGPWKIIYSETYQSRAAAMSREKQIKGWRSRKMIAELVDRQGKEYFKA